MLGTAAHVRLQVRANQFEAAQAVLDALDAPEENTARKLASSKPLRVGLYSWLAGGVIILALGLGSRIPEWYAFIVMTFLFYAGWAVAKKTGKPVCSECTSEVARAVATCPHCDRTFQ